MAATTGGDGRGRRRAGVGRIQAATTGGDGRADPRRRWLSSLMSPADGSPEPPQSRLPPRPTQRRRGALPRRLAPPPRRPQAAVVAPLSLDLPSTGGGGAARISAGMEVEER
jgi:hypothetical protein